MAQQQSQDRERMDIVHKIDTQIDGLIIAPQAQRRRLLQSLLTQFIMYFRSTGYEPTNIIFRNLVIRFLENLHDDDDIKHELFEIMRDRMKGRNDFVPISQNIDSQIKNFLDYVPKPVSTPSIRTYSIPRNSMRNYKNGTRSRRNNRSRQNYRNRSGNYRNRNGMRSKSRNRNGMRSRVETGAEAE